MFTHKCRMSGVRFQVADKLDLVVHPFKVDTMRSNSKQSVDSLMYFMYARRVRTITDTETNGPSLRATDLPWCSPIQVLTEVDVP